MPILAAELSEFPEQLLDSPYDRESDRTWWLVYTRPRQEKALARDLVRMEIPFYLPLVGHQHLIRKREVTSHLPLFGSYVFLYGTEEERVRGLGTKRMARTVRVRDGARLVEDLRRIRQLIAANVPLTIERRLEAGRRVRIRSGSMRGLEGTVLVRRGETRLLVAVDFLQQGASIAIEDHRLEPLD